MQEGDTLEVAQVADPDGTVRLIVRGELDQASARGLTARLERLRASGKPVRLDLSRLEFIDSGGVRAILLGVREARAAQRELEVDRRLSWQVKHVFDTLGVDAALWPQDGRAG